jgi:hypothetical protein
MSLVGFFGEPEISGDQRSDELLTRRWVERPRLNFLIVSKGSRSKSAIWAYLHASFNAFHRIAEEEQWLAKKRQAKPERVPN